MSDQTPPALSAEPEDHLDAGTPRKPPTGTGARYLLIAAVGAVVLFVVAMGAGGGRGDDPLQGLMLDVEGTRADLQLLEARVEGLEALESRISSLNTRLEESEAEIREELGAVSAYGSRLQGLEERLSQLSSETNLQFDALAERVESALAEAEAAVTAAEEEAEQARRQAQQTQTQAAPRQAAAPRQPPAPPRPPFRISGVEYRGGAPYLSIATGSGPVRSLSDVRLLGERQAQGDWQLVAIRGATAEFLVAGRTVTVPLP